LSQDLSANENISTQAGFVALLGVTNAGKSTLMNAMIGAKLSIVTHKVQTTRARVRGVLIEGQSQIVFVDAPGVFEPRRKLDRAMIAAAWAGVDDADIILLMIEAHKGLTDKNIKLIETLNERRTPHQKVALVINKIDRIPAQQLLELSREINERIEADQTFMISALKEKGLGALRDWLAGSLPVGPWLYPEDQIGDLPLRMLAAEITREKLTLRLHQELPYQLTVETESWEERKDGSVKIDQIIYVSREGHRGIVLGKKGETIRDIGKAARIEFSEIMGQKVHLFLRIKVKENWFDDPERFTEMGLTPDQ